MDIVDIVGYNLLLEIMACMMRVVAGMWIIVYQYQKVEAITWEIFGLYAGNIILTKKTDMVAIMTKSSNQKLPQESL